MKLLIISLSILTLNAFALNIEHPKWKQEWTMAIKDELNQNSQSALLQSSLNQEDTAKLGCPKFNQLNAEEKINFWVIFFSGLSKAESNFYEKAKARAPKGGHGNYGLLQISKQTARNFCSLSPEEILKGDKNLACGLKLMEYQVTGAPTKNGKITKEKILGRIFTSPMFMWGPLRKNDFRGTKKLTTWTTQHLAKIERCL